MYAHIDIEQHEQMGPDDIGFFLTLYDYSALRSCLKCSMYISDSYGCILCVGVMCLNLSNFHAAVGAHCSAHHVAPYVLMCHHLCAICCPVAALY